jgi:choline kinase
VPLQIGELESDVTVMDGDMPFSEQQMERLVEMVCKRLEQKKRAQEQVDESTTLKRSAARPARVGE